MAIKLKSILLMVCLYAVSGTGSVDVANLTAEPVLDAQKMNTTTFLPLANTTGSLPVPEGHRGISDKESVPRKGVNQEPEEDLKNKASILDLMLEATSADSDKNGTVPRKGVLNPKEPSKPRKGVPLLNETLTGNKTVSLTKPSSAVVKYKPSFLGNTQLPDDYYEEEDTTALTIGLSIGVALVLLVAVVSYWRLREVWAHRQYKRVDFLINGMYVDG